MSGRCREDAHAGFLALILGAGPRTRCRLTAGHDGKHHAWYQPYPTFADEHVWWDTPPRADPRVDAPTPTATEGNP